MLTAYNTDGYSQNQLDELNAEFEQRFKNGEWEYLKQSEFAEPCDYISAAEKEFYDEVARR